MFPISETGLVELKLLGALDADYGPSRVCTNPARMDFGLMSGY